MKLLNVIMQRVEVLPLVLADKQKALLDEYLETARRIWNAGLAALLEHDANTRTQKIDGKKAAVPRMPWAIAGEGMSRPVKTGMYRNKHLKHVPKAEQWGAICWMFPRGRSGGTVHRMTGKTTHAIEPDLIRVGQCCPITIQEWTEPRLGLKPLGKYSLQYYFTKKNHPEWEQLCAMPAWFTRGVLSSLWGAWEGYKKRRLGEPRFKRISDPIESLSYGDPSKLKYDMDTVKLPSVGVLKAPGLSKIVAEDMPPLVLRIVKEGSRWFLHVTFYDCHPSDWGALWKCWGIAGMDPRLQQCLLCLPTWQFKRKARTELTISGTDCLAVDDQGRKYTPLPVRHTDGAIDPHNLIPNLTRRIEALQQQISRQERRGTSNRLKVNRRKLRSLRRRKARILQNCRKKIAHFISERSASIIVRMEVDPSFVSKPSPKLKQGSIDPAVYEPNGASKVAEHNQQKSLLGHGKFVALLRQNSAERNQLIVVDKTSERD